MEIIGISGKAGSGKDYVGREVLRPAGYAQWAFAWPMKQQLVGQGFSYEDVHHLKPAEVREALQRVGTEEGWQRYGTRYWCDTAGAWLRTLEEHHGLSKFYISDVRFVHEANWIREQGGKLIRLEHGDRPYPLAGTAAAAHSSETALDNWFDWDAVIVNHTQRSAESIAYALRRCGALPPAPPARPAAMSLNADDSEQTELFL